MGPRKDRKINSQTYYVTVTFCDRLFGRDGSVGRSTDHWHVIHTGKLPFLDTQGLWGKLSTVRRELVSTEATTTRVLETEEDFARGLLLGRRLAVIPHRAFQVGLPPKPPFDNIHPLFVSPTWKALAT